MTNTVWSTTDNYRETVSGGGLTVTPTDIFGAGARAVDCQVAGKFYFEVSCSNWYNVSFGLALKGQNLTTGNAQEITCGGSLGYITAGGSSYGTIGGAPDNSTIGIAVDLVNYLVWYRVAPSGSWNGSGTADPATGVGGISIRGWCGPGFSLYPYIYNDDKTPSTANFGDSAFVGAVPSGFTAGWPAGYVPANPAFTTQIAFEEWSAPNPYVQVTQIALEEWVSVASVAVHADVTKVVLEVWCSVASASAATKGASLMMGI